jgi:tetratricopeptide (TPR) repeat protein
VAGVPARGLPPRIYLPILAVAAILVLAIVSYFLKIGLATTGAALGPAAQTSAAGSGVQTSAAPDEVDVPQNGGGAPNGAPGNGVGGGSASVAAAGAPPAPVLRLLTELRGRVARNPRDLAALVGLASLYYDAGKFPQAIPYYRRALALDPANPDTRTDLATALHATGDDLAALSEIDRVLATRPNFPPALFNRGVVAASIGRHSEAVESFQKFLKIAPGGERADAARLALKNLGA